MRRAALEALLLSIDLLITCDVLILNKFCLLAGHLLHVRIDPAGHPLVASRLEWQLRDRLYLDQTVGPPLRDLAKGAQDVERAALQHLCQLSQGAL